MYRKPSGYEHVTSNENKLPRKRFKKEHKKNLPGKLFSDFAHDVFIKKAINNVAIPSGHWWVAILSPRFVCAEFDRQPTAPDHRRHKIYVSRE